MAAEDLADAPLYLPYKALVSTVRSMVFSEAEAHRLIEILTEKAGIIQDAWHTVGWWWEESSGLMRRYEMNPFDRGGRWMGKDVMLNSFKKNDSNLNPSPQVEANERLHDATSL